jgi:hypothetical protein
MKHSQYSYPTNKAEIQEWLSNVKSLKFKAETRGVLKISELQKKLAELPKEASAFLTVGKDSLVVMVYTKKDRSLPVEMWKFEK